MCQYTTDMRRLLAERDQLRSQNAELVEHLLRMTQGKRGEHMHPGLDAVHAARALLARVKP